MPKYMIELDHAIDTCDRCPVCLMNSKTGQYNCLLAPYEKGPSLRTIPISHDIRKPDWCPLAEVTNDLLIDTSLGLLAERFEKRGVS